MTSAIILTLTLYQLCSDDLPTALVLSSTIPCRVRCGLTSSKNAGLPFLVTCPTNNTAVFLRSLKCLTLSPSGASYYCKILFLTKDLPSIQLGNQVFHSRPCFQIWFLQFLLPDIQFTQKFKKPGSQDIFPHPSLPTHLFRLFYWFLVSQHEN